MASITSSPVGSGSKGMRPASASSCVWAAMAPSRDHHCS